jgi:ribose-phosphate pyrophosphokinase
MTDRKEPNDAMKLSIFAGSSHPRLAAAVARELKIALGERLIERYPDGVLHVEIEETVRGHDVFLFQAISAPMEEHLFELLLLADACQRAGAARLIAVIPYFGYARQDRRVSGREPIAARVVADLIGASAIARVIAVDLHTPAIEGFMPVPLEHLSVVPRRPGAPAWTPTPEGGENATSIARR